MVLDKRAGLLLAIVRHASSGRMSEGGRTVYVPTFSLLLTMMGKWEKFAITIERKCAPLMV